MAHRLSTVMDADRVLVMHDGRVAEFDKPKKLLARPGSLFSKLVRAQGLDQSRVLSSIPPVLSTVPEPDVLNLLP